MIRFFYNGPTPVFFLFCILLLLPMLLHLLFRNLSLFPLWYLYTSILLLRSLVCSLSILPIHFINLFSSAFSTLSLDFLFPSLFFSLPNFLLLFLLFSHWSSPERKDEEIDRRKGSGAGQTDRVQKRKEYCGQCVHPGPFNNERIKEEMEEDGCTVRSLQDDVLQGRQRENVWIYEREPGISQWLVRKKRRFGKSGKERERNERIDEEPGKACEEEKLQVNIEKTKMMVLNKRKRKSEEIEWKWKGRKIERVSKFKYLG
jgi:hypothetical protein